MKRYLPSILFLAALLLLWQLGAGRMDAAYILPTPIGIEKIVGTARTTFCHPSSGDDEGDRDWTDNFNCPGHWSGNIDGCKPGGGTSPLSNCYCLPDDSDNSDCAVICRLVWIWYLEQDCGDHSHDIFSDYNYRL